MDGSSSDQVGEGIERLEERFGSFPVNQTTITVAEHDFEAFRERSEGGVMDVYVRVRNDDGDVLHVGSDDDRSVPRCVSDLDSSLGTHVRTKIRKETGIHCEMADVARVTIAGVNSADVTDEATVYRLGVLVDAAYERGTPEDAVWEAGEPSIPEYV